MVNDHNDGNSRIQLLYRSLAAIGTAKPTKNTKQQEESLTV
jgi:hypothetical protein